MPEGTRRGSQSSASPNGSAEEANPHSPKTFPAMSIIPLAGRSVMGTGVWDVCSSPALTFLILALSVSPGTCRALCGTLCVPPLGTGGPWGCCGCRDRTVGCQGMCAPHLELARPGTEPWGSHPQPGGDPGALLRSEDGHIVPLLP